MSVHHYVRTAWRHLSRRPHFSILNIFGLSLGVASVIIIGLYLRHEFGFDAVQERADRIYRIVADRKYENGRVRSLAPTSPPLAESVERAVPEIEASTRIFVPKYTTGRVEIRRDDKAFYEEAFFFADPTIFDIFSIGLLEGATRDALARPKSLVISKRTAHKYFGAEDPMGKTLVLDDSVTVEVTGVMADLPSNSHIRPDFLAPYALLEYQYGEPARDWWGWDVIYTYVLLDERTSADAVAAKVQEVFDREASPQTSPRGYTYASSLQLLTDIHLQSDREWEIATGGNAGYLKALALVALFILLLAGINFVNLSTARSASRSREIGVRKVLGSSRHRLILQFLAESTLLSLAAIVLGVFIASIVLPVVNSLTQVELTIGASIIPLLVVFCLVLGVAAGAYPALYLSSLRPSASLRRGLTAAGTARGRGILVTAQFAISIILTAATFVVYQQARFLQARDPGFDEEQVLVVTAADLPQDFETVKNELRQVAGVTQVSASSGVPGRKAELMQVTPGGSDEQVPVQMLWIEEDFEETLGLEVVEGEGFGEAHRGSVAYIVNEAAADAFGWTDPVGKTMTWTSGFGRRDGHVVGVVRDFHVASPGRLVEPLVLTMLPQYSYVAIRFEADRADEIISAVGAWWKDAAPGRPFEYAFLDEVFGTVFEREQRQALMLGGFAVLAVLIACLGLLGLAAYTAESRTKEIGVRKVLGASVLQIYSMLTLTYVRFIIVALLIATPITIIILNRWLEGFAYRITLGPGVFLLTGAVMMAIALGALGYQSIRAALADPVESLRYE